jgi:hypothetical protein
MITKNINPFFIYTDKNCLYIKNINSNSERLQNNVKAFCANIDSKNNIHICCIDNFNKLIHITNINKFWGKRTIAKVSDNVKNIKLHIIGDYLNIFILEDNQLDENLYNLIHFNVNFKTYKTLTHKINNIIKDDFSIYKLNLDDFSNFILKYNTLNPNDNTTFENSIIFNNSTKTWMSNDIFKNFSTTNNTSNIKNDLFEYLHSIEYKI